MSSTAVMVALILVAVVNVSYMFVPPCVHSHASTDVVMV